MYRTYSRKSVGYTKVRTSRNHNISMQFGLILEEMAKRVESGFLWRVKLENGEGQGWGLPYLS